MKDALIADCSSFFCLQELKRKFVVALPGEHFPVDQHKPAVFVDQDLLRPECGVRDIEVVQEVDCANDVIDHADDLYLLVEDVDHLP